MLKNAALVANIGVDTTENEPSKVSRKYGVPNGSSRGHPRIVSRSNGATRPGFGCIDVVFHKQRRILQYFSISKLDEMSLSKEAE